MRLFDFKELVRSGKLQMRAHYLVALEGDLITMNKNDISHNNSRVFESITEILSYIPKEKYDDIIIYKIDKFHCYINDEISFSTTKLDIDIDKEILIRNISIL